MELYAAAMLALLGSVSAEQFEVLPGHVVFFPSVSHNL
jgi:hypothetical protein